MKMKITILFGVVVIVVIIIAVLQAASLVMDFSSIPIIEDPRPLMLIDNNFAVFPENQLMFRGQSIVIMVGIKNNASDYKAHDFLINVVPSIPGTESWLEYTKSPRLINYNLKSQWVINIETPMDVESGNYLFYIVACTNPIKSAEDCDLFTTNYGEPKKLVLTVRS